MLVRHQMLHARPAFLRRSRFVAMLVIGQFLITQNFYTTSVWADSKMSSLGAISSADGTEEGDNAAALAAKQAQDLPSESVIDVLAAFSDATPRGRNWLRSLAADVSDNGTFQQPLLTRFFRDRSNDADARYVAYQLLVQNDPESKSDLLSDAASDPSLPVRFLKIKSILDLASKLKDDDDEGAKAALQTVIENGRSPAQLEKAVKMLSDLGVEVDLANELGMVREWQIIGPFDNTDSKHFATAYLPENRYAESGSAIGVDADGKQAAEQGKRGEIRWQNVSSDDSQGMVDLNPPLANEKDGVAYVFATLTVGDDQLSGQAIISAQARLGCITANKVWVNGQEVLSNEVYHSGTRIDQYIGDCTLQKGKNTVLIKVLQNAQTQPWAQDWQFQFRFTRPDGSAIKVDVI